MRRVQRLRRPSFVDHPEFWGRRRDYETYRAEGGARTSQHAFRLEDAFGPFYELAAVHGFRTFLGKCAYTEVPLEWAIDRLELHRPAADAYDEDKGVSAEHYWWTTMWHGNWYVATEHTSALKRNGFPVLGRRATPPGTGPDEIPVGRPDHHLDRGVLLDPCRDHPQLHLRFREDGMVTPWYWNEVPWLRADRRRGEATIELLDLNSDALVASRQEAIGRAIASVRSLGGIEQEVLDPSLPHIGAVRQVLAERFLRGSQRHIRPDLLQLAPELVPLLAAGEVNPSASLFSAVDDALPRDGGRLRQVLARGWRHLEHVASTGPDLVLTESVPVKREQRKIPRSAAITRVEIVNFQAIERLELDVPTTVPDAPPVVDGIDARPWTVLLGENGVGKSSVLKAIGLALAGDTLTGLVEQGGLRWPDLLRQGRGEGRITVELTGGRTITLRFDARGGSFDGGAPRIETFVRGFGATRLLERGGPQASSHVRLGNLYNPRVPVVEAEAWLAGLPDEHDFNVAAVAIAQLLDRQDEVAERERSPEERFIRRDGGEVTIGGHPMRMLSDGYRSMVALACDLMAGAGEGLSDMRNATGIVLLDELGSHLHPRWKMKVTRTLRQVFPSMQFIVTTHEPLCLRGLYAGEVIGVRPSSVDRAAGWYAELDRIEESPSRLRVDQLLTSEFFGLDTAIDPDVDEQFQRYYAMIRRNLPDEAVERERLRIRLSRHGVLGYTARDQLVYEAVDNYLAWRNEMPPAERAAARRATLASIADIWGVVARRQEGADG